MKIALNGKKFIEESKSYVQEILDQLHQRQVEVLITDKFKRILAESGVSHQGRSYQDDVEDNVIDYFLSIGGDGTFLDTITLIGKKQIPVMGINTGRLGFLANIPKEGIGFALDSLFEGRFEYEYRTLLRLQSDSNLFGKTNFALNDFTILKKDSSSMITVHTYINGEYLNSYWADGLIVATPTGATGYSLSCGGPLVMPDSHNFIITPVSAHNLNVRPMVVSDDSVISFEIEGRTKNFLVSLDSRSISVDEKIQMSLKKESFKVKMVRLPGHSFLDTLRNKLNWGFDARN